MAHRKFSDIVGEISPERRLRVDKIKEEYRADAVAFNLAELRPAPTSHPGRAC